MYAKKALTVLASLALAEQALGFNSHRHVHNDKRAYKYDIVTEWVTVTVIDGQSTSAPSSTPTPAPVPAPAPAPVPASVPAPVVPQPKAPEIQNVPTTTSTSIVVAPTPTPVIVTPSTTLVTSVAPKAPSQPAQVPAPAPQAPQPAAPVIEQAFAASKPASKPASVPAPVPVSSAKSSAAPVATSPATSPATGGKRGVAYNDPSKAKAFFNGACKECSWAYNWDSSSNGLSASGVNYVPMLWGPIDIHTARWTQNANAAIAKGSDHILSFNECDNPSQCNLDAGSAAAAHVKYMNSFAGKVRIGSPAITNSNIAGEGLDWLKSWVSACKTAGCVYDFCVTHWYSPSNAADTLFSHLQSVHEICDGKPVWLTEFAPFGSNDQINSFVQTNVPKLDSVSYLERYSYFMASDGVLNSGSSLSALGQTYASV